MAALSRGDHHVHGDFVGILVGAIQIAMTDYKRQRLDPRQRAPVYRSKKHAKRSVTIRGADEVAAQVNGAKLKNTVMRIMKRLELRDIARNLGIAIPLQVRELKPS